MTNFWHWRLISSTKLHTFYQIAFSKSKMLNWKMAILLHLPYFWVSLSANINSATTSSLGNRFSKHSFSYYLWTGNSQSCLFATCLSALDQTETSDWFFVYSGTVSFIHTVPPFCLYKISTLWIVIYHSDHSLSLHCRVYLNFADSSWIASPGQVLHCRRLLTQVKQVHEIVWQYYYAESSIGI